MRSTIRCRPALLLILLVSTMLVWTCSSDQDAKKTAAELANRLSEALEFDNGYRKEGDPPAGHADDSSYPQVIKVTAPARLRPGVDFEVIIEGMVENPADVAGAVVAIEGADAYIQVTADYNADTRIMRLTGQLDEDDDLYGENFDLSVALQNNDGTVGNYMPWKLEVPEEEPEDLDTLCEDVCQLMIDCDWEWQGLEDMESCLGNCKQNQGRFKDDWDEACYGSLTDLIYCAIQLGCEDYSKAFDFSDGEGVLYCTHERNQMDVLCPDLNLADYYDDQDETDTPLHVPKLKRQQY